MSRRIPILAAIAAASMLAAAPALAAPGGDPGKPADVGRPSDGGATSSYIVQFTPAADRAAEVSKAVALGMDVTYVYDAAFSGMAVLANRGQATALQQNPNVALIEGDAVMTTQSVGSWGLDRIDQADRSLDGSYSYQTTGAGVTAYIIDTGIRSTHTDLSGRVKGGTSTIRGSKTTEDCNGHGTHVAGTIGGETYGVAKDVNFVPVRVLGCNGSGTASGLISGINWVIGSHGTQSAVANLSLGFSGVVSTVDTAIASLVADGVVVTIAAGNSNVDACNVTPARVPTAITVGATDTTDTRASFSNFGKCVDAFAPGVGITSSWYTSTTATNTISGTSMAAPHVAGVAARILQANPGVAPATVASAITGTATQGKVVNPGTASPNLLLFASPTS